MRITQWWQHVLMTSGLSSTTAHLRWFATRISRGRCRRLSSTRLVSGASSQEAGLLEREDGLHEYPDSISGLSERRCFCGPHCRRAPNPWNTIEGMRRGSGLTRAMSLPDHPKSSLNDRVPSSAVPHIYDRSDRRSCRSIAPVPIAPQSGPSKPAFEQMQWSQRVRAAHVATKAAVNPGCLGRRHI
jgi:hypothetical protein